MGVNSPIHCPLKFVFELKVSLCSVMNLSKKRWLSVVRLARAGKKSSIKIKIIVHINLFFATIAHDYTACVSFLY